MEESLGHVVYYSSEPYVALSGVRVPPSASTFEFSAMLADHEGFVTSLRAVIMQENITTDYRPWVVDNGFNIVRVSMLNQQRLKEAFYVVTPAGMRSKERGRERQKLPLLLAVGHA